MRGTSEKNHLNCPKHTNNLEKWFKTAEGQMVYAKYMVHHVINIIIIYLYQIQMLIQIKG